MSSKLVGIREAAEFLGVTPSTLRRWEREGKLLPDEWTTGGYRRYDLARLRPETFHRADSGRRTVAYARVSSHDQKDDLERQKRVLELYCARQGWTFEIVADLGSGMNYHKKGLKRAPPGRLASGPLALTPHGPGPLPVRSILAIARMALALRSSDAPP